ncbi:MAG: hypothetical protein WCR33_03070, partial [Bacilli bacterium]
SNLFASFECNYNTIVNPVKFLWNGIKEVALLSDAQFMGNVITLGADTSYLNKGYKHIDASYCTIYAADGVTELTADEAAAYFSAGATFYNPKTVETTELKVVLNGTLDLGTLITTDFGEARIVSATVADEATATIDGETLTGLVIGETTLTVVVAAYPENITAEVTIKVVDPIDLMVHVYVDPALAGTEAGTTVTAAGVADLVYGETATATINEAIALAGPDSVITLAAGDYDEDFTVVVNNLTITGPNYGTAGYATRVAEANVQGVISIANGVTGLTINGIEGSDDFRLANATDASGIKDLTMTNCLVDGITTGGSANVFIVGSAENPNENFTFTNNYMLKDPAVEDNTTGAVYYPEGDIYVGNVNGLTIDGNIFDGAFNIVNFTAAVGGVVTINNNQFLNFQQFGLRLASYSCTQLDVTNNYFYAPDTQDLSSFVGPMRFYDGFTGTEKCFVNVTYNKFEEIYGWYPIEIKTATATIDTMEYTIEYNEFKGDKHTSSIISVLRDRSIAADIINMGYNCFLNTDGTDGTATYLVADAMNDVTATGADFADEAALIAGLPAGATFGCSISVAE